MKARARTYGSWQSRFAANDLMDFTLTEEGRLWLKLRSIERRELLASFVEGAGLGDALAKKDKMEKIWSALCADADLQSALRRFMAKCLQSENKRIDSSFTTGCAITRLPMWCSSARGEAFGADLSWET